MYVCSVHYHYLQIIVELKANVFEHFAFIDFAGAELTALQYFPLQQ